MVIHVRLKTLKGFSEQMLLVVVCLWSFLKPGEAYVSNRNASDINNSLIKFGIIPDLLKAPPLHAIKATYSFGYSPNLGNKIDARYLKSNPYVILWPFEGKKFYTLVLVDLDEPTPETPTKREWLHYMLGNIPGPAVSQGEILAPYVRPMPNEGTHRLVFLVYRHPQGRIEFREKKLESMSDPARSFFSSSNFARKYNLGDPFAVNFFLVDAPPPTTPGTEDVTEPVVTDTNATSQTETS